MKRTAAIAMRTWEELKADLEALAEADRRSLASYIEGVLQAHVDERKAAAKAKPKARTKA